MVTIKTGRVPRGQRTPALAAVLALLLVPFGCTRSGADQRQGEPVTLRIGFGLAALASVDYGLGKAARNISTDPLLSNRQNGRTLPSLAAGWSVSNDGLIVDLRLRPSVMFHDGKRVTAQLVREVLLADLPDNLGPAYHDIADIRATSDVNLQ